MWHVYILRSAANRRLYTGSTDDLARRLAEHKRGKSPYTRHAGPFELLHTETFDNRLKARRRERYLKTGRGREELKTLLNIDKRSTRSTTLDLSPAMLDNAAPRQLYVTEAGH